MSTKRTSKSKTVDLRKQPHYTNLDIEPINVIKDWVDDYPSYLKGSIIKYVGREQTKGGIQDLKKAQVYLEWLIQELE